MLLKIRRWVAPPRYSEDHEKTRSALLLNIVIWLFVGTSSMYGLFAPIDPEMRIRRAVIILPFVILLLFFKYFLNRGHVRTVAISIVILTWLVFTGAMLFGADYNNPAFMGYLVVVVTAGLILNWRAAIGWSVFSILTNAIILSLGQLGYLHLSRGATPPFAFWTAQTAYILVTTVLLSQAIRKIDEAFEKTQHEIMERKRVEAERENFIKELETKNAELERFTYTVSHDLKSPLVTINGYLSFLEKDAKNNNQVKFDHDLIRIREATEKMQALLNDLLELSRIGRLMNPSTEVTFDRIAHDAVSLVDISLRAKNVKVFIQNDLPIVHVDRTRMIEVVQNLLENATKFMGSQPEPRIEIGATASQEGHIFFVRDNGIGIPPEHHERIFGLFNKLNPDTEGTGVGLALVKRAIEVHGGKIWVESKKGEGTTFYFTLPEKQYEI